MKELKCPKCGTMFTIDEADYASIVNQIKTNEFENELNRRIKELSTLSAAELEAERARTKQETEKRLAEQRIEMTKRDNEIARLKEQMNNIAQAKELELHNELVNKELKLREMIASKNNEINQLKISLGNAEANTRMAIMEEQAKAMEQIRNKDSEIADLRNAVKNEKNEALIRENHLREQHKAALQVAQEQIDFYRDYKAKMSTKMLGETLEEHCKVAFEQSLRPHMRSAYFDKDNDASSGTKGDFIFRDFDEEVEYISIMFEMKNEADTTSTKHKNEHFFSKLDEDRRKKGCEYAVLVSMLEADNEVYNAGIVDVSYRYEKMYVVRPQFFVPIITLLTQAAKKNIEYKRELAIARRQSIDVSTFESELMSFKDKFSKSCRLANDRFQEAIKAIDASIKKLEETKSALLLSEKHLGSAENHSEELTIRKLTKNNPTMDKLIKEARKRNEVTYEILED